MSDLEPTPAPAPQPSQHPRRRGRRLGVVVGSGALVVSAMTVGGVALAERQQPSAAGTGTSAARQWQQGYGAPPAWRGPSQQLQQTADQQTTEATSAQSAGLVMITSTLTDGEARGTGMVLTSSGEVVTNHHVVAGATSIEVTVVSTGKTYTATYVGGNATVDVAVLRLQGASGLTPVDLDSASVSVGDAVTAVGDANGDRGSLSAATGTVSATGRSITVTQDDGTQARLSGLIELDADVISGDSGGAVLDADGEVVGMNVAASSGSANVTGYAIPIATVTSVVDRIDAGESSSQVTQGSGGYLGVGVGGQPGQSARALVVQVADGSAAADAGIVAGDTITSVGGVAVTGNGLSSVIAAHAAGDRVVVGWTTANGARRSATITLGSRVR